MRTIAEALAWAKRRRNVMIRSGSYGGDWAEGPRCWRVSPKDARYRGVGLVWTAIFVVLMILLMGLSLDTARVALVMHQMHNAADGAALAGAMRVREDPNGARALAQAIAQENFADQDPVLLQLNEDNDPNGDIVIGWYNRQEQTFTPSTLASPAANSVAVITTRSQARIDAGGPVPLTFGGALAGVETVDLTSRWQTQRGPYAIAMAIGGTGAGLIALKDYDDGTGRPGLSVAGTGNLDVMPIPPALPGDGEVQINSPLADALHVDGQPDIIASAINVTGEINVGNYDLTPPFNTPAPPIPDPLAALEPPTGANSAWSHDDYDFNNLTAATSAMVGDNNGWPRIDITIPNHDPNGNPIPWDLYPGYYSEGFYINCAGTLANPTVRFHPGVYIIGGSAGEGGAKPAGLVVTAQSYAVSEQATFYITSNAAGTDYGIIDIQAGAGFRATEPESGYYAGVTFFQDRANDNPVTLHGSGALDLDGTLYFPKADPIYLRGGGDGFGNQLIGWTFDVSSTTEIGIQYDGRNRSPTTGSFLVE